ncbi:3-hydroxyisobutyrate dehydrogenase-like beta-hydroxyacid dehydrogenase [Hydrogenophaga palleronii]|uniref:3-hydroxyisobutyrate dehydrogenase-like beta-hydroxyacid dehydrogenase n=1 Tax=Hydrogenophaga palleronii TaxID=65655 RepID=A0ABU1WLP3_9BURK|nr:NAD(P)-dependent oxidoreductase [Hydrogenophaga palleronii]MDR7150216.1 3-hydroxyisobutyrate dehydrogenase-like beta-hydroxyacid dehydrogenase [Hydrogenophaga palleronii]
MSLVQPRVAVIGAGNMGGGMVGRLCDQSWPVVACDIDPDRQQRALKTGAQGAGSPHAAATLLEEDGVLIVCVVDAVQTNAVLFSPTGAARAMRPGQVVLMCPTLAPDDVEAFAQQLGALGIACIDAPMSGGPARARDGSMSLMVAGKDALLKQHEPLLSALSSRVFRISERVGDAARTKLVNNLLAGINLVGAAEALALAERMGLDASLTLDVIEQSSGQSWIGTDRMRRAIADDLAPRAHVTLLEKDTRLAVRAAQHVGFAGPLGAKAAAVFAQASAAGLGGLDDAALLQWLRQAAKSGPGD